MLAELADWLGFGPSEKTPEEWEVVALVQELRRTADAFGRRGCHAAFDHFEWLCLHLEGEWRGLCAGRRVEVYL